MRGATVKEIISSIGGSDNAIERVQPSAADARDMLEVWWRGEIRKTRVKKLTYQALRLLEQTTSLTISPWVNLVLRKVA